MTEVLKVNSESEAKKLVHLAIYTGQLMMINGGETYRAEDTVVRICKSRKNLKTVDVFAISSAIFVSVEYDNKVITHFKNVQDGSINLDRINEINEFSRRFVKEDIPFDEAEKILSNIQNKHTYSKKTKLIFSGLCTGSFSILFGGGPIDFLISFLIGIVLNAFQQTLRSERITFFIENFVGAIIVSVIAFTARLLGIPISIDATIIGGIMLLVPGMIITNALRDIMGSDYISGIIGIVKGIFSAFSIAVGCGIIINLFIKWVI